MEGKILKSKNHHPESPEFCGHWKFFWYYRLWHRNGGWRIARRRQDGPWCLLASTGILWPGMGGAMARTRAKAKTRAAQRRLVLPVRMHRSASSSPSGRAWRVQHPQAHVPRHARVV